MTNIVALCGGGSHSLALKADGGVVAWGNNLSGQCNFSPSLSNVTAIAAGDSHSVLLLGIAPSSPQTLYLARSGNQFILLVQTVAGKHYALEYKNVLTAPAWTASPAIRGSGSPQFLIDSAATAPRRFYRVRQW